MDASPVQIWQRKYISKSLYLEFIYIVNLYFYFAINRRLQKLDKPKFDILVDDVMN